MNIEDFRAIRLTNKEAGVNVTMIIEAKSFDSFIGASKSTVFTVEEVEVTEELLKGAQIYAPLPRTGNGIST